MGGSYKSVNCEGTVSSVSDAFSELESLKDEMTEWRDNLEEKFSGTQKYEDVSACCDELEQVDEVEVPEVIGEVKIAYSEMRNRRKGRGESRSVRRDNAVAVLQAAKDAAENWLEGLPEDDENKDQVSTFIDELDTQIGYAEGAEFPGMF